MGWRWSCFLTSLTEAFTGPFYASISRWTWFISFTFDILAGRCRRFTTFNLNIFIFSGLKRLQESLNSVIRKLFSSEGNPNNIICNTSEGMLSRIEETVKVWWLGVKLNGVTRIWKTISFPARSLTHCGSSSLSPPFICNHSKHRKYSEVLRAGCDQHMAWVGSYKPHLESGLLHPAWSTSPSPCRRPQKWHYQPHHQRQVQHGTWNRVWHKRS